MSHTNRTTGPLLSRDFVIAVKLAERPAYKIALAAGLPPATLSKLLHGAIRPTPNDPRVAAVAEVLGLPLAKCFEADTEAAAPSPRSGRFPRS